MSIKLLFFLQIHKKAKPYIRFHLIIYSGRVDKKQRRRMDKKTSSQAYRSPPYGGGAGGRAYILVILNHLKHVGNLLDAFLQGLLHHLLDEHIEFGLDGEFHLA